MSDLQLLSPFAGRVMPLADSPDPVFAGGLIGEGLAIDPTIGELRAPCAGIVTSLQATGHALTVRSDSGAEILIHIGVDTVNLGGEGFSSLVREGQRVAAGERLIAFDLAAIKPKVTSMVSMMVLANGEAFKVTQVDSGGSAGFDRTVMTVTDRESAAGATAGAAEAAEFSLPLRIAHGLHARPAAQLAAAAKAHGGAVSVTVNGKTVNAKSVVALMGLGSRFGDILNVRVEGSGADVAADRLLDLVLSGLGDPVADRPAPETEVAARPIAVSAEAPSTALFPPGTAVALRGRSAVAGLASGPLVRLYHDAHDLPRDGADAGTERSRLSAARAAVSARLLGNEDGARAAVGAAHREILDDPAILEDAMAEIAAGRSAEWAWNAACRAQADVLAGLADARMAERAADMRDVAAQVVAALSGSASALRLADLPVGSLVLSDEILPSETAGLAPGRIAAILMRDGGPTSHAAIIAAGLGIPTIVALGKEANRIPDGAEVIVDAGLGTVTVFPDRMELVAARKRIQDETRRKATERANAMADCRLADGTRIEVFANLGRVGEGALAVNEGAEGCGLLRSEFLFLGRPSAPSEEEQFAEYQAIADELGGRPLIVRTLDVGGDKPLAYLPLPKEENPFLGLRGVRVGLSRPELLRTQLRAIVRVRPFGVARIMVPMVASVSEMVAVRKMVEEERTALGRKEPIEVGAMIEVPAAAVLSRQLAEVCDFFSIGTNDLTQYALAMDRGNPGVAAGVDALHPGVLGLVRLACVGAADRGRPVAVCGGAASDPLAAPVLVGLGVRELSAAPAAVSTLKAALAVVTLDQCQSLAERALGARSAAEVRAMAGLVAKSFV